MTRKPNHGGPRAGAGRPPKPDAEKRTERIHGPLVTVAAAKWLNERIAESGLSRADYLRRKLFRGYTAGRADP